MNRPDITVEINWDGTETTWTDVTSYVRGFSTTRGRRSELSRIEMGTAQVLLDNRTRRFEPEYAAGPYYPNVVPLRAIRIRAVWATVTYPLFYGYVGEWPQDWDADPEAYVNLPCVDKFELMNHAVAEIPVATSLPNEKTGERIGHVFTSEFSSATDFDTGTKTMQQDTVTATNMLSYLQDVAASELGVFYVAADGTVVYDTVTTRAATAVAYTFGDQTPDHLYTSLEPSYTKDDIVNEARVTREGGTEQVYSDTASSNQYGPRSFSAAPLFDSDSDALGMAQYIVGTHKDPHLRIVEMSSEPQGSPTSWPAYLSLLIGTKVTVNRQPGGTGATLSNTCFVEGVAHTVTTDEWKVSVQLSPAQIGTVWVLGTSALGTSTRLFW